MQNGEFMSDKKRMLAAVICDDKYHPASVVKQGVEGLNAGNVDWEFVLDTSEWSPQLFERCDVIVLAKGNSRSVDDPRPWLSVEIQQGFSDFVARGRGLLVVHSGTVGYKDESTFKSLVGGGFIHHPEQSEVTVDFTGQSEIPGMPSESFTVHDEHYLMEMYAADNNIFMTSTSPHSTQPAGWTRRHGKGKVCVLTPGHNLEVWLHPQYQNTILNALNWCHGRN